MIPFVCRIGEFARQTGDGYPQMLYMGYGGMTTSRLFSKLEAALRAQRSQVIVHLGGNDLDSGMSAKVVFRNLQEIVDILSSNGARVLVAEATPRVRTRSVTVEEFSFKGMRFNFHLRSWFGCRCIQLNKLTSGHLHIDGIHLNSRGNRRLLVALYRAR